MMGNMLRSEAMKHFEPGTLDMCGAEWTSESEYRMQPGAKRYEQYERNFAAVVRAFCGPTLITEPERINLPVLRVQILAYSFHEAGKRVARDLHS